MVMGDSCFLLLKPSLRNPSLSCSVPVVLDISGPLLKKVRVWCTLYFFLSFKGNVFVFVFWESGGKADMLLEILVRFNKCENICVF